MRSVPKYGLRRAEGGVQAGGPASARGPDYEERLGEAFAHGSASLPSYNIFLKGVLRGSHVGMA